MRTGGALGRSAVCVSTVFAWCFHGVRAAQRHTLQLLSKCSCTQATVVTASVCLCVSINTVCLLTLWPNDTAFPFVEARRPDVSRCRLRPAPPPQSTHPALTRKHTLTTHPHRQHERPFFHLLLHLRLLTHPCVCTRTHTQHHVCVRTGSRAYYGNSLP